MLDPAVPATVVPYYGPWTVMNNSGEVVLTAPTQDEALRSARADLPAGSILAIDAATCTIRFVVPSAIERQLSPTAKEAVATNLPEAVASKVQDKK